MNIRNAFYLMELRERHVRDREGLRRALAGRRQRALKAIERRQREVEVETARILETVNGRGA
jgi:hypothetical protein